MTINVKIIFLLTLWALAFAPVHPELIDNWRSHSNYAHEMLVLFISLCFIWIKTTEITASQISSSSLHLIFFTLRLVLYDLLARVGRIVFVAQLMIVCSLVGIVLFTLGKTILKTGLPSTFSRVYGACSRLYNQYGFIPSSIVCDKNISQHYSIF